MVTLVIRASFIMAFTRMEAITLLSYRTLSKIEIPRLGILWWQATESTLAHLSKTKTLLEGDRFAHRSQGKAEN